MSTVRKFQVLQGFLIAILVIQIIALGFALDKTFNIGYVFASMFHNDEIPQTLMRNIPEHVDEIRLGKEKEKLIRMENIRISLEPNINEHKELLKAEKIWAPKYEEQVKLEAEERARIAEEKRKAERKAKVESMLWDGTKGDYQAYAWELFEEYGWDEYDLDCLIKLWNRESGWSPSAHNKSSGAHGIPQSLPASKMASEGADYYDNPYTQIRWGVKYIKSRYGAPRNAWAHSEKHNWY